MLNLSLNELKLVAKSRGIKCCKTMSKERLLSALSESELESEKDSSDKRLKKIRKDFNELRDRFSKPQLKKIRRNFFNIKKTKKLSTQKIKEIEENLFKLEKCLSSFKKYCPQDDFGNKNLKGIRNLFNGIASNDEDYYKPIKAAYSFDNNNNYIENQSKGDKGKDLSVKKYLYMVIPYLSDIINNHKAHRKLKVHWSSNEVIDYETEDGTENGKLNYQWKLIFVSSKDSNEIRAMHTKSNNIDILMGSETKWYY